MPFINGIGPGEIVIILIIALIVVGPGKLPDVGSALGKSIREFRKAATDVKESTSLDPTPTPAQTSQAPQAQAPQAPVAPAAEPVAPIAAAVPMAAALPPASGAMTPPAAIAVEAATDPEVAAPAAATAEPATTESWPEALTPADESQPTPST